MRNRLLNLFTANAKRGEFKAEGNTLYVYDVIVSSKADAEWFGGVDAETFVKTLAAMEGDVTIRINSPGGDVFAGVSMASAIAAYPGKVTVAIDGYAASAASVVAIAGDSIEMSPGSFMMIHKAWTMSVGNADDMTATASLLEKIDGSLATSYTRAAAKRGAEATPEHFAALMADETWLTAAQAVEMGLADKETEAAPKNASNWDLSAYTKAPAQDAATDAPPVDEAPKAELSPDLNARQGALYEALEGNAETFGKFDQTSGSNGAHYMPANPFAAEGINCANCAFYQGPQACELVAGDIAPDAICKLWVIPENKLGAAPQAADNTEIAARIRAHEARMLLRPA